MDGLTVEWKDGYPVSDWEGKHGRLHTNLNFWYYDTSGMGPGTDIMKLTNFDDIADELEDMMTWKMSC